MKHDSYARAVSESIGEDTVAYTKGSERCFHAEMQGFYLVGWLGVLLHHMHQSSQSLNI